MSVTPKNPGQFCLHLPRINNLRAKPIHVLLNPTLQPLFFPLDADFLEFTPLWDELVLFRRWWGRSAVMTPLW